jgi:VCBS repeat-containing protein
MIVNLVYDAIGLAAPQSFRDGMQAAANMLDAHFLDNITINITVGYGEYGSASLESLGYTQNVSLGNIGATGTGTGITESYSDLRALLASFAITADDATSINALPTGSSIDGQSSFLIGTAQGKALGITNATDATIDGQIGMGTGFTGNVLFAGALHEITHAMGRIAGTSLDLFRFNEADSSHHVFGGAVPATAAFFSINGGSIKLADFGITSDPGDFLNGGVQGSDPLNETVGGRGLTITDLIIMDVLGFHAVNAAPTVTALSGSVGEDGPSFSKDLLTGTADPDGDTTSIQNLAGSITTTLGRSLTLGTDYTLLGSTLALTSTGFAKFNSLSQGVNDTAQFGYNVQDFLGVNTHNTLTLTINGLNDGPLLSADSGSPHPLTEFLGTTNSASLDQVSGTLSFTDVDLNDTHTASAGLKSATWSNGSTPAATLAALAGAMSDSISVDATAGTLAWQFALADNFVDFLAVGETLTVKYDVTVADHNAATSISASSTKQVTIVFTGTNDSPVVETGSSILANSISELPNVTGSLASDATAGVIAFFDPDLSDRPTATINAAGQTISWQDATHNYTSELTPAQIALFEGAFTISAEAGNTNAGNIDWGYSVVDNQLDFLGGGESITVTTPVVIDDHKGATISQNVVVTINGANDDPIAAADSKGTAKNSTVSVSAANGLLANDTDPDIHDQGHLFVGEVNGSATNVGHAVAGTYGSVTINANGSYVYAANQGALPSKIVAQDIFNYTVADGHGGTDTSTLSVVVFNPGVNYLAGINTTLNGGNGKNVLDGSAGHDLLNGGNSPDVLIGGVGDTLTGGNGPDTFLFRPDFGANKITDFDVNNDAIQFDKSIFTSVADLISHTSNSAGGAVISDGHGDTITLASVTLAQLQTHTSDFFFV